MLSRRDLLVGSVAAGCLGCEAVRPRPRKIRIGKLSDFGESRQVLELVRVVLLRDGEGLSVMSLVCSHQGCLVASDGAEYVCPCHGSRFSVDGKVLTGPASRDLAYYELSLVDGELYVDFGALVGPGWRLSVGV